MSGHSSFRNRTGLDTLLWLIADAFDGDPHQSLMANLRKLREQDWTAVPPGGLRSIVEILEHVGWAKWMYQDYAFGTASLRGDQPPLAPPVGARARPPADLLAWLRDGHRRWVSSIQALADDRELDRLRLTNWGESVPTRTIVRIMINHDIYHAGEINHLRALLQDDDRWRYP
jgi:uncharacterized damage-inducible protein DinB